MVKKVIWTAKSEKGLQAIFEFIARDSPIYAERFVLKIIFQTEHLLLIEPKHGRFVPELAETPLANLRELIIDGYRVIYQIEDHSCTVISVMSGRMDFESNF